MPLGLPGVPADAIPGSDGHIDRTAEPWGDSSSDEDSYASDASGSSDTSYLRAHAEAWAHDEAEARVEARAASGKPPTASAEHATPRRPAEWGAGYDPTPSSPHLLRSMFFSRNTATNLYAPPRVDDPERTGGSEEKPDFERQLWRDYGGKVIYRADKEDSLKVNIATLQRLKLQRMRKTLVEEAFKFKYLSGKIHMSYLDNRLLHEYGTYGFSGLRRLSQKHF
jgi:hypothetical protein